MLRAAAAAAAADENLTSGDPTDNFCERRSKRGNMTMLRILIFLFFFFRLAMRKKRGEKRGHTDPRTSLGASHSRVLRRRSCAHAAARIIDRTVPAIRPLHRCIMWLCARSVVWRGSSRRAGRCKGATGGPTRRPRHRLASRCVPRAAWANPGAQQDKPASPHHHLVPATRGERAPGCRHSRRWPRRP
jgi:hypothetical protein